MNVENLFHLKFKLQGKSFSSVEELIAFSEEISSEVAFFLSEWFNNEVFVEVKTSGSTGTPKPIQLQKKQMVNSAKATGNFFNLNEGTTALLCMSANFIAGKMMLVRALTLGWELDIVEPSSHPLNNSTKNYDFVAMVPLQLTNSIAALYRIKKLIVGGGVVSSELLAKIQSCTTEIYATYGMTETITHIAVKSLNNFFACDSELVAERSRSAHYKLLPNIKISTDKRGCLVINAPKIADEVVITNDLVELISETEFKWLGRFDSVINSGGIKLIPEQIEEKLASIIMQRFFVAGIDDAILGEKLILVVESATSIKSSLEAAIRFKMQQLSQLSKYEIPKQIYFLDQFIETETNKINRSKTVGLLTSRGKLL